MNLIIDVGNTRVKVAVFEQDKIVELLVFNKNRIISEVKKILKKYQIDDAIMSSVSSISSKKIEKLRELVSITLVSSTITTPFKNLYSTPKTLGVDRIALVFGAVIKYPNKNTLVIDAGTCITFDFVNKEKEYLGGAISPGVEMRYKSLHQLTAKLPLLEKKKPENFIGNSTKESINSGVVNGVIQEIEGVIQQYKKKYLDLTVVLTGGDTNFLSKQLKSSIFANQNFLLEGLNEILIFNKNK
ncbi:pantothenate kinase [Polaribacter reichenbachii]|uniref:Type III pantothenate kinase n=1 Tax=Polaribacter reichenbachii TaxID=996801 RepID=A0A1B8TWK2_9FLAO|nr:type III pantothenate kinase [Polaribacter reichenbachii]APZ45009.1 pantothenate kinase [Polaribacter reichenbachii]AUC18872.1 pantothenate kinase [Polaribacter reichenbachii]OBY63970.1 type III pantothenate kinase [Polaribacter reichenbachii]